MCDEVGKKLAGRMAHVHINREGRRQARALASRLQDVRFSAVVSSPLERAVETASPLARRHGLEVEINDSLQEIDAGTWTGCEFRDLSGLQRWSSFNTFRSCIGPPGGELMIHAQARIISGLEVLRTSYPEGIVAAVSHGDVIKSALAHYTGVHLDLFQRIEISPASVTVVALDDTGPIILCVNDTGALPL